MTSEGRSTTPPCRYCGATYAACVDGDPCCKACLHADGHGEAGRTLSCEVFGCNGEEHHDYDPTCNAWVAAERCPEADGDESQEPADALGVTEPLATGRSDRAGCDSNEAHNAGRQCPVCGDLFATTDERNDHYRDLHAGTPLVSAYVPWPKWKRRRIHARWAIADLFHLIGYKIAGNA